MRLEIAPDSIYLNKKVESESMILFIKIKR